MCRRVGAVSLPIAQFGQILVIRQKVVGDSRLWTGSAEATVGPEQGQIDPNLGRVQEQYYQIGTNPELLHLVIGQVSREDRRVQGVELLLASIADRHGHVSVGGRLHHNRH